LGVPLCRPSFPSAGTQPVRLLPFLQFYHSQEALLAPRPHIFGMTAAPANLRRRETQVCVLLLRTFPEISDVEIGRI
jgi:hypothetical protein